MEPDPREAEKFLQIYEIFRTNGFGDGVKIKAARFNHSCQPNANSFVRLIPNLAGAAEVRAIRGKIFIKAKTVLEWNFAHFIAPQRGICSQDLLK